MALQSVKGMLHWPLQPKYLTAGSIGFNNNLLDASSEKSAGIFHAPKAGTISKICFRTGTVTTGATMVITLESVSLTTGDPGGALDVATQVVAATDDNVWFSVPLDTGYTATKGELLAIVIANPVASFGNLNISLSPSTSQCYPYSDFDSSGWTKNDDWHIGAVEYSDGSYAETPGLLPFSAVGTTSFNSGSTPDEIGNRFRLPFPCKTDGASIMADGDGDFKVILYDSDGVTVLAETPTIDANTRFGTSADYYDLMFTSEVSLLANTYYRLVLQPTTTTSMVTNQFSVATAAVMDAMPGGQDIHKTSAKNPTGEGSWTQVLTDRLLVSLMISALDDGVGGGGGMIVHPGMVGGMRG